MLDLTVDAEVREQAPWRAELRRQVARMITAAARLERRDDLEVSLRLTSDAVIRELNREFRHKDKATDVLAFAQREGPWAAAGQEVLGDVVISLATARRQAKRKTPAGVLFEVRFLAAHGLCHLLGYDHRNDEEERVMNERMAALLAQAVGRGPIRAA